ncbi:MAG: radical SAM protein [Nannocystaceae bacterium]|nr:radical SAM protein [bacterium]
MAGLLDIILGYDCNLACTYCTITEAMRARALSAQAVAQELERGRAHGFDAVSMTGGEPTIRPDLLPLVRRATRLGYERVKVQSNGLVLGVGENAARLVDAGVTCVHISVHTHEPAAYEAMVRREGTYAHMQRAFERLATLDVELGADVILEADTLARLPAAVDWLAARGVPSVDLWFVSLTDANASRPQSMPSMSEAVPFIAEARVRAEGHGMRMRSLHIPPCILGEHADLAFNPALDRVRVVSPDAVFDLADSAITPRQHVPACEGCGHRPRCGGLRPDYIDRFGDVEVARARGVEPSVRGRSRLPVL